MVMSALQRIYDWGRGRLKGSFYLRLKGTGTSAVYFESDGWGLEALRQLEPFGMRLTSPLIG